VYGQLGAQPDRRSDPGSKLPIEKLERLALEQRVHAIADQSVIPGSEHEYGT
jgi:hypothetical protein